MRDDDATTGRDDDERPHDDRGPEQGPQESTPEGATSGRGRGEATETGETGGPKGPEPTRYGDWERKGRCIDF